jgi:hypothetical protein
MLEPMKDVQLVLYQFGRTRVPDAHPRTVLRMLSKVINSNGTRPFVDTDVYRLLVRLRSADPGINTTAEYDQLAKTGWFEV